MKKLTMLMTAIMLFSLTSCGENAGDSEGKQPLAVRTVAVRSGTIKESLKYVGTVHSKNEIKVLSRVVGKVSALPVPEGKTVKRGTSLALIAAPEMAARVIRLKADVDRIEEESSFACEQADIDQKLLESGTIRQTIADASRQKCNSSKSGLQAAQAGLNEIESLAGNRVERAPFSGTVLLWLTEPGENTMPGKPLVMFGDRAKEVRIKVHEKDIANGIKKGSKVSITPANGQEIHTTVTSVAPMALGPGRMVEVRIAIASKEASLFTHGSSVDVSFILKEKADAVMVPVNSITKRESNVGLYLVKDDKAEWQKVTTTIRENGWVAVTGGLKKNDRVIVGNLDVVRDGRTVYAVDSEGSE